MTKWTILLFEKAGGKVLWFSMLPERVIKDFEEGSKLVAQKEMNETGLAELLPDDLREFLSRVTGKNVHFIDQWDSPMGFEWGGKIGVKSHKLCYKPIGEYNVIELYGYTHIMFKGPVVEQLIDYFKL